MTYGDALNWYNYEKARDDISEDSSLSFSDKIRGLANLSVLERKKEPKKEGLTLGRLFHGLVGAGVGLGVAKLISNKYDVSPEFSKTLSIIGASAGAALNSGLIKMSDNKLPSYDELQTACVKIAEQRRNLFKMGFNKALKDSGYFKKVSAVMPVPMIPITPSSIMAIPKGLSGTITNSADIAGSALGALDSPNPEEETIARLQVEHELLQEKLQKLLSDRRNRVLRQILAKRQTKR